MTESLDYESNDSRIYYGLMRRVGLQGDYQKNFMRIIFLVTALSASTFFIVPFLFYQESYQCPDFDGDCNKMVCSLPESQRSQYLPSPLIHSLANHYGDMHCEKMADIDAMQQMFLIGTTLGLVVIVIIIEYLGRKLAISVSMALTIISMLLILTVDSKYVKGIGLFIWGGGSQISYSILMTFVTEKIAQHSRVSYYFWMQIWFINGCLLNYVLFYLLNDWVLVMSCYFILFYVVAVVLFVYYVQSTPLELISRKTAKEAYEAFMRIASRNQVNDHGITLQEIQKLQQQYKQTQRLKHNYRLNFLDLFKYSSIRGDFLKISFVFFIIAFELYGPTFLLNDLQLDFYGLGMINVGSQYVTLPILRQLMINYPRRKTQTVLMTASTLLSFTVFGLAPDDCFQCNSGWKLILTLVVFFCSRALIYLSSNIFSCSLHELFPAQIRSIGIYSAIAIGRIATILIPHLHILKDRFGLSLMLQFSIVCLVGIFAMAIQKQTWRVLPSEIISEIKERQS